MIATTGSTPDQAHEISYCDTKVIGNGSFGVVYQARLLETGDLVAIKKVLQDKRFKVSYQNYILLHLIYCKVFKSFKVFLLFINLDFFHILNGLCFCSKWLV